MAKKLFGNHIEPACEYCEHGKKTRDGQMVLCERKGVVAPYFCCRKFLYAPLKRVPKTTPALPKYDKEQFEL
ncbi:MAG: hypothetical protein K0R90_1018 [Oscillospiraceae bacterium]|nr:hypothetical protein [Oscillospiraceae bacterium]